MDDFLKKIKNIKSQKLEELEISLKDKMNKELTPLQREADSLESAYKQKSEQKVALEQSRGSFEERNAIMQVENKAKQDLINKFFNEYFEELLQDDEKYSELIKLVIRTINPQKGKLEIDERTFKLIKSALSDELHIVITDKFKGFKFSSDKFEVDATTDEIRREMYEKHKIQLNNILFD
jgi:vacuolar-type H+-ATPase subunit E/Vma4